MYDSKFVAVVMVGGRILKELRDGTVPIPFDTEYALRLRNKHDRRAVVKVFIDGENVSGNGYVVPARDKVDIRRHADKDEAFRFVSVESEEAYDHGKNGPDPDRVKGVVEVRFFLEKERPKVEHVHHYYPWYTPTYFTAPSSINLPAYNSTWNCCSSSPNTSALIGMNSGARGSCASTGAIPRTCDSAAVTPAAPLHDCHVPLSLGCTVPGGATGQSFSTTYIDAEDHCVSIRLVLRGTAEVVPSQTFCGSCGAKRRHDANFCGSCGGKF